MQKTLGNPQADTSDKKAVYGLVPYCRLTHPSKWQPYASGIAADLSALDTGLQEAVIRALGYVPLDIFVEKEARAPGQICLGTGSACLQQAELATLSRVIFHEALFKMPVLMSNTWRYVTARVLDMGPCFPEAVAITSALFAYVTGLEPVPTTAAPAGWLRDGTDSGNANDDGAATTANDNSNSGGGGSGSGSGSNCSDGGSSSYGVNVGNGANSATGVGFNGCCVSNEQTGVTTSEEYRIDLAAALIPVAEGVAAMLLPHIKQLVEHVSALPDAQKWTSVYTVGCLLGMLPNEEEAAALAQSTLFVWLRKDRPILVYLAARCLLALAAKFPQEGAMWRVPAAIALLNLRSAGEEAANRNVCSAIAAGIPPLEGKFAPPIVSPLVQLVCAFQDQTLRLRALVGIFTNGLERENCPLAQQGALQSLFEQSAMGLVWGAPSKTTGELLAALLAVAGHIAQAHQDVAATLLALTKGCLEWGAASYTYAVASWARFADSLLTALEKDERTDTEASSPSAYKTAYGVLAGDISKALLYVNDTTVFAQLAWLLVSHLSLDDISSGIQNNNNGF